MTFYDELQKYDWDAVAAQIESATDQQVRQVIAKRQSGARLSVDDFAILISPAADKYIEQLASMSRDITRQRFGYTMQMFIPLYLANYCSNSCTYCGFSALNKIKRTALTQEQLDKECLALRKHDYQHILLVSGESETKSGLEYLAESITTVKKHFEQISIEVQPLTTEGYKYLMEKGLHTVAVYQETYNEQRYPIYHPKGPKSNYRFRLETADRLGQAGMYKICIGALLGLEQWRVDCFFVALHLRYLENKYWKSKYSISFPRLRPCAGDGFQPNYPVSEKNLLHLICAYRLFSDDVELTLSSRERPFFRDNIFALGVTSISAGAKTAPGAYSDYKSAKELEQFEVNDDRSVGEIVDKVKSAGLEPVWKDWSLFLQGEDKI